MEAKSYITPPPPPPHPPLLSLCVYVCDKHTGCLLLLKTQQMFMGLSLEYHCIQTRPDQNSSQLWTNENNNL